MYNEINKIIIKSKHFKHVVHQTPPVKTCVHGSTKKKIKMRSLTCKILCHHAANNKHKQREKKPKNAGYN